MTGAEPTRSVGIVGGLGPGATCWIYLEIIRQCAERGAAAYPSVSIHSVPLNKNTEAAFVAGDTDTDHIETLTILLAEALRALSEAGSDLILIPCNTLHLYLSDAVSRVGSKAAPVANMPYLAARALPWGARPLVLGTGTTAQEGLYGPYLPAGAVYPASHRQKVVESLILRCIEDQGFDPWPELTDVLSEDTPGADALLIACTDLCLTSGPPKGPTPTVGSLQALANFAADFITGRAEVEDASPAPDSGRLAFEVRHGH